MEGIAQGLSGALLVLAGVFGGVAAPDNSELAGATALGIRQGVTSYSVSPYNQPSASPGFPGPVTCIANNQFAYKCAGDVGPYPICTTGNSIMSNFQSPGAPAGVFSVEMANGSGRTVVVSAYRNLRDRGFSTYAFTQASRGNDVVIAPGEQVTLQWSCQPSQGYIEGRQPSGCTWGICGDVGCYGGPRINIFQNGPSGSNFNTGGAHIGSVTVAPTQTTTYSVTCSGSIGSQTLSIPVTVDTTPIAPPTVTISATRTAINVGSSTVITATFTPAARDTLIATAINGPNSSNCAVGVNCTSAASPKSFTFTPTAPGTYTFVPDVRSQRHPGWNHSQGRSVTITATIPPPPPPPPPCVNGQGIAGACTSCDPGYRLDRGACVLITSCPGQNEVPPLCTCATGFIREAGVCIPLPPTLSISANPLRVSPGTRSTISWNVTGLSAGVSCSIASNPTGVFSQTMPAGTLPVWSGSAQTAPLAGGAIVTLSCSRGGSQSVAITLIPDFEEL